MPAVALDVANNLTRDLAGCRGAGCDSDTVFALQHLRCQVGDRLYTDGWCPGELFGDLGEAIRVITPRVTNDNREISAFGHCRHRLLSHLCGMTDFIVDFHLGEAGAYRLDEARGVPLAERGLIGDHNAFGLHDSFRQTIEVGLGFDEGDVFWRFANDTFRLRVAFFADVDYLVSPRDKLLHEVVRLGDIGACGVYNMKSAFTRSRLDTW